MSENSNMLLGVKDKPPVVNLDFTCYSTRMCYVWSYNFSTNRCKYQRWIRCLANTCSSRHLWYRYPYLHCSCTRGRSPVYLGSSFAFIAPMVAGYAIAEKPVFLQLSFL